MLPELKPAFEIEAHVGPIRDFGATPYGRRRVVPILGGVAHGPRLQAEIVPGGADWQIIRPDGVLELEARYTLKSADGAEIAVVNRGLRRAAPEIMDRMSRGEAVDPALVYFRTVPIFEAPVGPHEWLNRSVFIATAVRLPDKVTIRVFELL